MSKIFFIRKKTLYLLIGAGIILLAILIASVFI